MKVTFTRIRERGYSVTVEGPGIGTATMNPAPGYDDRLPHDAAHFIVENELGIIGGIFGQIAAGGTANTFNLSEAKYPKKAKKRGSEIAKANKKDALFSEHAVYAAQSRWEKQDIIPDTQIPSEKIQQIIQAFEDFATRWSKLPVGGSITLEWRNRSNAKRKR